MSTFKQKTLFAALAMLGVLGVVDSAQAVPAGHSDQINAAAAATAGVTSDASPLVDHRKPISQRAHTVRFMDGSNPVETLDFDQFLTL